jgi:glycosyltransferase involved in cell wall biosynthesis
VRDKGQEYLLEAVSQLAHDGQDIFLVLVGDGRERQRLEWRVEKLGLSGRVRMIPGVGDTTSVLRMMDAFVHPATYREGFGLAIAEALAAGKPVILTKIPALDTLFTDGADALLVPPKDAGAIAEAVLKLSRDPERAHLLASRGREKVYALCRADRQADEMERIYQEVIASVAKQSKR